MIDLRLRLGEENKSENDATKNKSCSSFDIQLVKKGLPVKLVGSSPVLIYDHAAAAMLVLEKVGLQDTHTIYNNKAQSICKL